MKASFLKAAFCDCTHTLISHLNVQNKEECTVDRCFPFFIFFSLLNSLTF